MSDLIRGKALIWVSWDARGVVTSALRSTLVDMHDERSIKVRHVRAVDPSRIPTITATQIVGLALWTVYEQSDVPAVCKSLARVRDQTLAPVCLCFIDADVSRNASILAEAGAQIVVSRLPSLWRALPRILSAAPLSNRGYHPLTTGLVDRLPWSEIT